MYKRSTAPHPGVLPPTTSSGGGKRFGFFTVPSPLLRLLLGRGLGLCGLLAVAADHDDAEEGADDGGAEENEDNGDADGPDAGREEVLERMVVVDKGLQVGGAKAVASAF